VIGVEPESDAAIRQAQDALWATLRVVAEPGGAAAFSALLGCAHVPEPSERVGVWLAEATPLR
jgi:threonine dehydratase